MRCTKPTPGFDFESYCSAMVSPYFPAPSAPQPTSQRQSLELGQLYLMMGRALERVDQVGMCVSVCIRGFCCA